MVGKRIIKTNGMGFPGETKEKQKKKKKFGVSVVWWRARGPDLTSGFASTPFASLMTEDKVFTSPSQSSLKNGDFIPPSPTNQHGKNKDDRQSVPGTWGRGGGDRNSTHFPSLIPFPCLFQQAGETNKQTKIRQLTPWFRQYNKILI